MYAAPKSRKSMKEYNVVRPIPKKANISDRLSELILTPSPALAASPAPAANVNTGNFIPVATTPQRPSAPLNLEGGRKTRKCKNDATFVWLNLWYKSEFEQLGWMVLAKSKGYDEKVYNYINSAQRLYYQLECKVRDTKDHDKKQELMIMLKDLKCLIDHIHKDF